MKNALHLSLAICFFSFFGCHPNLEQEVARLESSLEIANKEIRELKAKPKNSKKLVHVVWFKMKSDADKSGLIAEIKKLEGIDFLEDLEVGKFVDLGDPRAMSDLDLVMQMNFDSEEEYQNYQTHALHLELKKAAGKYLAGPPVTYDFRVE